MPSDPLTTLGTADRNELEALLVGFDLDWAPDRLPAAVNRLPSAGRLRTAGLRELVRIDMERHARLGKPVPLDDYAARYPELLETGVGLAPLSPTGDEPTPHVPGPAGPPRLPDVFGRYRILRPLGRGGMGSVYLARDTELDRMVALKVPHFRPDDPDAGERFAREARAAAMIDHPNVCRVYDVGRTDGIPFLTMAYVDGRTLSDEARADPQSPRRAAEVVRDVARGMAEAHRLGVVHRDLKPGNILLAPDGRPVVTDFGLARRDADDLRLTTSGTVLGTPLYMAPEQVAGDTARVGPASDVYSLGVVLYELLAGRPPFGTDRTQIMAGTLSQDPPPPSSVRREVDPRLDAVVLKAMTKRPAERPTMTQLADALDDWLKDQSPPPARRPRSHLVAAGLLAVLLLLVLPAGVKLGWFGGPRGPEEKKVEEGTKGGPGGVVKGETTVGQIGGVKAVPKEPAGPMPLATGKLPAGPERLVAVGFSHDGRQVHTADRDKAYLNTRRWDAATGREEPATLKRQLDDWAVFSLDGRRVLVGGGMQFTELYRLADGELVIQFNTGPHAQAGAVSRDGKFAIIGQNSFPAGHLARVFDTGSGKLAGSAHTGHRKDLRAVALSDDRRWAVSISDDRFAVWEVSSNKPRISEGSNTHRCAVFVAGTEWCVVGTAAGEITLFDVSNAAVQRLDYPAGHQDEVTALAAFPDGKRVLSGSKDGSVRTWDAATGKPHQVLHEGPVPVACVAISPDGKRVAAGFADRSWRVWEIP